MLITAATAAVMAAGCTSISASSAPGTSGGPSAASPGITITGTFTLNDRDNDVSGTTCRGTGGYSDIVAGLSVVVKNDASVIIGTGSTTFDSKASTSAHCVFPFTVAALPDSPFYSVEVGHRGAQTYSKADLQAKGWKVELSLGS